MTTRAQLLRAGAVAAGLSAVAIGLFALAPPGRAPAPGPPPLRFRPGARQAYALRIDSTLRLAGSGADERRTIQQTLSGTLHLRVLDPGADGARVALQLEGGGIALGGVASAELDRQLGRLFLATFAADGTVTRFEFPPAIGEEARVALQEAIRTFQVVVPPGAGDAWSTEEANATGRYRAEYRFTTDGRILKRKVAYLDAGGPDPADGMRVRIRRADATARIDPGASWLERVVDEEELAVSIVRGLYSSSSLRAGLERVPVAPVASSLEIDEAPGSYGALSASLATRGPAPPPSPGAPRPEPRDLAALVRALDAREATSAALLYELRDLLTRDPAAAGRLLAILRAGVRDRTAAALVNALGMAATDEAQAALRAILKEPALGRMNRTRAALALGGAPEIDDDSLAALGELASGERSEGLADTAVLSLGTAADTLRRGGSRRYAELRDDLVRRANDARDGSGAAAAVLALGNTHDAAVAEAVQRRLGDPSVEARAAAAHALGKLGRGADPDLLARRLAVETDGTVRLALAAALNALGAPSAEALALVDQAVARERDAQARYEMARLLGDHLATYPAARDTLAALAREDPSRRIREYTAHALWGRP